MVFCGSVGGLAAAASAVVIVVVPGDGGIVAVVVVSDSDWMLLLLLLFESLVLMGDGNGFDLQRGGVATKDVEWEEADLEGGPSARP